MSKKKWLYTVLALIVVAGFIFFLWFFNHDIVDKNYNKLTITHNNFDIVDVITDEEEINEIIDQINNSPRKLDPSILRPVGGIFNLLIFENDEETHRLNYQGGNVQTEYFEIQTNFEF